MKLSTYDSNNAAEVEQLFIKTFSDSEGQSEGEVIGHLVRGFMDSTDGNDLHCFKATEDEQIIGSIFFTRMTFESGINAFILSPVATHTDHQGKGVGQKLINFGLAVLKENGVELVITYGDPGFYSKVGFSVITEQVVPAKLDLVLLLNRSYRHLRSWNNLKAGWLNPWLVTKLNRLPASRIVWKHLISPNYGNRRPSLQGRVHGVSRDEIPGPVHTPSLAEQQWVDSIVRVYREQQSCSLPRTINLALVNRTNRCPCKAELLNQFPLTRHQSRPPRC